MISHGYKCIFVHINKCAGGSIDNVLKYKPPCHTTIAEYREQLAPEIFNSYYSFSFVRNPWARMVSAYVHRRWRQNEDAVNRTFGEWVRHFNGPMTSGGSVAPVKDRNRLGSQFDWISLDGEVMVDFVGRFETLQADFDRVCDRIEHPRVELPHTKNRSLRPHYSTYYDSETREMVAGWAGRDAEFFGYEFEKRPRTLVFMDRVRRSARYRLSRLLKKG